MNAFVTANNETDETFGWCEPLPLIWDAYQISAPLLADYCSETAAHKAEASRSNHFRLQ